MGGPYKRKKYHYGNNTASKSVKTKRRTKDLDEIDNDLKPENAEKLLNQEIDYELPGNGQFYCVCCVRHFIDDRSLKEHRRSKLHKRRLKDLEPEPYTIKESEAAGGIGTYRQPKRRKIEDPAMKAENDKMQ